MSFTKAAFTQGEQLLEAANKWHQTVALWTIVGAIFVVTAGVLANIAGFPGFNYVLAGVELVIGIYFLTKPAAVLSVFGLGSFTSGLPDIKVGEILRNGVSAIPNFELKKFLGAGWAIVEATTRKVAHVFFFLVVLHTTLGTFPIADPAMVLPVLVILTGIGLWAALFTEKAVWYKRVTIGILLVALSGVLWKAYVIPSPSEAGEEAEKLLVQNAVQLDKNDAAYIKGNFAANAKKGGLTAEEKRKLELAADGQHFLRKASAFVEETVAGRIKIEYRVPSNIAPEKLPRICGVPPGEYEFELGGDPFITVATPTIEIYSLKKQGGFRSDLPLPYYNAFGVLLNGAPVGSTVVVGIDGCATVSFNIASIMAEQFSTGAWKAQPLLLHIVLK